MRYLRTIQDILDYAIQQEAEANNFYTQLTQKIEKDELRTALENFAVDEFRHKLRLEGVKEGQVKLTPEENRNRTNPEHIPSRPIGVLL